MKEKPKVYMLEPAVGRGWRLRRAGNRHGTLSHQDKEKLRQYGLERGWEVREEP